MTDNRHERELGRKRMLDGVRAGGGDNLLGRKKGRGFLRAVQCSAVLIIFYDSQTSQLIGNK
jgi:hypothetical protein